MKEVDVEPEGHRGGPGSGPPSSVTPGSLLDRLRTTSDGPAWDRLFEMYAPTVEGWCRRAGLSPEDAADVRQEVFRSVARGIAAFRRDRPGDSFRGWLFATTRRRVFDHLRRAGGEPRAAGGTDAHTRLTELPADEPPASEAGDTDVREVYRRSVLLIQAEFEERTWRAFWRVAVDGRRAGDVAVELGMTPGAVYIAKSRVLKRLREEFGDLF